MWSVLWSLLNSPLGVSLIASGVGWVVHKLGASQSRESQVLGYADTAFQLIELLSASNPALHGYDKYKLFVQQIVNALKAAGQPELSGKEMAMLQQLASVKAMLAKDNGVIVAARSPSPPPLPLPPPPRG